MKQNYIIFSDFDGTITKQDTLDTVFEYYKKGLWREYIKQAQNYEITIPESFDKILDGLKIKKEEIEKLLIEKINIVEGFDQFLNFINTNKYPFFILSGGFNFHIQTVFNNYNIRALKWFSNEIEYSETGTKIYVRDNNIKCHYCGNCKIHYLLQAKKNYKKVIYIGDGLTDIFAVHFADIVFAKDFLRTYCIKNNISAFIYNNFFDILSILKNILVN